MHIPIAVGEIGTQLKPYIIPLVLGGMSLLSLVIGLSSLYSFSKPSDSIEFSSVEASSSSDVAQPKIVIDISGGVVNPGVYAMTLNSRVEDVIEKAGGLSDNADLELIQKSVNRAARVSDGAKLYIPIQDSSTSHNMDSVLNTSHNINTEQKGNSLISINSASNDALESLPGIGAVTATKIIDGRPYMSVDELVSKKIVGQKVFSQIQSRISL